MNRTPRSVNRVLVALLGLLLMAAGAGAVLVAAFPGVARWWQDTANAAVSGISAMTGQTQLPGQQGSWIWVLVALAMFLAVILLGLWIAAQGGGRTGTLVSEYDDDGAPGRVAISAAVAEQSLKAALLREPEVTGASVSTYAMNGISALRVRNNPRQGAAPHLIAADATGLVEALDAALGRELPVLLSIETGSRFRFGREDRVR